MLVRSFLVAAFILLQSATAHCSTPSLALLRPTRNSAQSLLADTSSNSANIKAANSIMSPSWASTLYLAAGCGLPQGIRCELGYTISDLVSLGICGSVYDSWGYYSEVGSFGLCARYHPPLTLHGLRPYLFASGGASLSIFNGADSFVMLSIGTMYELRRALHLRPELGIVFCNRHISGGNGVFSSSPELTEPSTRLSFHLALELDLSHLF